MEKITDEEWQNLHEHFEAEWLLEALNHFDIARYNLCDIARLDPPELRADFLALHALAVDVLHNRWIERAQELFDKANDLEMELSNIVESLEFAQRILNKLVAHYPESLTHANE